MDEIIKQIKYPKLLLQIERVVPFHGYLSTGAFIGIQMFNIAQDALGFRDKERIYVTCETSNCIPDAFQILAGATIGNNGMRIVDFGKMAVVVNLQVPPGVTCAWDRDIPRPRQDRKIPEAARVVPEYRKGPPRRCDTRTPESRGRCVQSRDH